MERTLIIIKPDGSQRNLVGEIIRYYERAGLKVAALRMMNVSRSLIEKHYPEDDEYMKSLGKKSEKAGDKVDNYIEHGRMIVKGMRDYMTSGPVVAMILEGKNAIQLARHVTGYTDPASAEKGTIRGDLGEDTILKANSEKRPVRNLIHAAGSDKEAKKEIRLWFPEYSR